MPVEVLARRQGEPRSLVRTALICYVLLSPLALGAVAAGAMVVSHHLAREEALRDATTRSEGIARGATVSMGAAAARRGDPDAIAALSQAMSERMREGSLRHIVLWDLEGTILWADNPHAVGTTSPLPAELRDLTVQGGTLLVEAGERKPHPGRDGEDSLLEVYVGAVDADGRPFLFEAYVAPDRLDENYRAIRGEMVPTSIIAMLFLELLTLPLALSVARRIELSTQQRSLILHRALRSWHEERRRLAQELHDGLIQDLSAMGYALPAVLQHLPDDSSADDARATGSRMSEVLVRDLRALRSMVLDLVPSHLDGMGLAAALQSLAQQSGDRGLQVRLTMAPDLALGEAVGGLVYRTVREGLRNVEKHAGARSAQVDIAQRGNLVDIVIVDDGDGVRPGATQPGHIGLSLLGQLVRDLGGSLELSGDPVGGAVLRVTIPTEPDLGDDTGD